MWPAEAPEPEEAGGAAAAPLWARESIARDDGGVALATEPEARTTQKAKNLARMNAITINAAATMHVWSRRTTRRF